MAVSLYTKRVKPNADEHVRRNPKPNRQRVSPDGFADDDPYLYELIDGELVKEKASAPRHQLILGQLYYEVETVVRQHKLGVVLFAPVDVFLDEFNAPQPDLVFVAKAQRAIITNDGVIGTPSLVVEIISPSSVFRDRVSKKALYERFGIAEYWLIEPADSFIEVYGL